MARTFFCYVRLSCLLSVALFAASSLAQAETPLKPMRPLPAPRDYPLAKSNCLFVDSARGDDAHDGSQQAPWKTLRRALRRLKPGDMLSLRGGTYYERVALTRSGEPDRPITISSYPGE